MVLQHDAPQIDIEEERADYARVTAGPLARGAAHTIGNALRRVLLSGIQGAAITSVKIDQVQHEFSTIPHMKEDTTEFLLNLRGIRLRALADREAELTLDVSGSGQITAAQVSLPGDYEIVNPDLYLATLDAPEAQLTVAMQAKTGYGFQPSEQSVNGEQPLGLIPLDAVFTPVRKVTYRVQQAVGGRGEGLEQLTLEVWTNGAIAGKDAIQAAAQLLQEDLVIFATVGQPVAVRALAPHTRLGLSVDEYNMPIEELNLSVRAHNCLKRSGLMVIGQILEKSEDELLTLRNFGEKSYVELIDRLQEMKLLDDQDSRVRRARDGLFVRSDDADTLTNLPPPETAAADDEPAPAAADDDEPDDAEPVSTLGAALLDALREAGKDPDEI